MCTLGSHGHDLRVRALQYDKAPGHSQGSAIEASLAAASRKRGAFGSHRSVIGRHRCSFVGRCYEGKFFFENPEFAPLNQLGLATWTEAIAAALQVSHVRCLDLYCNSFGDSGATHVAQAANSCNSLRELDLGWNSVCDPGAAAIATCLMQNQTLLELGLEQNAIGENGAKALAAALQQNHSLIKLRLRGNPLQGGFELKASGRLDLTERSTARASLSSEPEAEGSAQATRPSARNGKKSGRLHVGLALALAWT
ncbi:unnamed protein product [Effrenium voratum]|nr:unnamed protein product [Effrenium voratum]